MASFRFSTAFPLPFPFQPTGMPMFSSSLSKLRAVEECELLSLAFTRRFFAGGRRGDFFTSSSESLRETTSGSKLIRPTSLLSLLSESCSGVWCFCFRERVCGFLGDGFEGLARLLRLGFCSGAERGGEED